MVLYNPALEKITQIKNRLASLGYPEVRTWYTGRIEECALFGW